MAKRRAARRKSAPKKARKKPARTTSKRRTRTRRRRQAPEEERPGPTRRVRRTPALEELEREGADGPQLSAGDLDADWERGDSVGEEAVGGTVDTPDQDLIDEIGEALGVPHELDEELRASSEILEERDERRE